MNKSMNKKELLFLLRDYINHISYEDMQDILRMKFINYEKNYRVYDIRLNFEDNISISIIRDKSNKIYQAWLKNGELHRDNNKPARINCTNNMKDYFNEYWINGVFVE